MTHDTAHDMTVPNSLLYLVLTTLEDLMGKNGLTSILNITGLLKFRDAYPPNNDKQESLASEISQLISGVIDLVGKDGAKALLRKAGQQGFLLALEESPELLGVLGIELKKMASDRERIGAVLGALTFETNSTFEEGHQSLEVVEDGFKVHINNCEWCLTLDGYSYPICFAEVGLEEEMIQWATGKRYPVEEIACRAAGAKQCVFHVIVDDE
jgi:predicted hydrocarbon binding protein